MWALSVLFQGNVFPAFRDLWSNGKIGSNQLIQLVTITAVVSAGARGAWQERCDQDMRESSPKKVIGELRSGAGAGISQTEQKGRVFFSSLALLSTDTDSR